MTYRTEQERVEAIKESRRRYYLRKKKLRHGSDWVDKRTTRTKKEYSYEYYVLARCKNRAKKKGIEFSLKLEDIIIPDFCPVLNIPLQKSDTGLASYNSPSVDRIDSTKGYTKDNIQIISWRANKLKADSTLEESFLIYQYFLKNSENKG